MVLGEDVSPIVIDPAGENFRRGREFCLGSDTMTELGNLVALSFILLPLEWDLTRKQSLEPGPLDDWNLEGDGGRRLQKNRWLGHENVRSIDR